MLQNNPSITLVSNECHPPFLFYVGRLVVEQALNGGINEVSNGGKQFYYHKALMPFCEA